MSRTVLPIDARSPVTEVAGRKRIGYAHRHTPVDIDVHEGEFHVYDRAGNASP
jgi:hypothetical protein